MVMENRKTNDHGGKDVRPSPIIFIPYFNLQHNVPIINQPYYASAKVNDCYSNKITEKKKKISSHENNLGLNFDIASIIFKKNGDQFKEKKKYLCMETTQRFQVKAC